MGLIVYEAYIETDFLLNCLLTPFEMLHFESHLMLRVFYIAGLQKPAEPMDLPE